MHHQAALGWPASLWVVRHGESAGNIARDHAESNAAQMIDIAERDVDVPLSDLGERQARALGEWIAGMDSAEQPTLVVASSYVRAIQTAEITKQAAGLDVPLRIDERLREREFGVLDRLTRLGIRERFPQEAALRSRLGKFYHRPAGGESWTDVIARVRAALTDLRLDVPGERVLIVAHQVDPRIGLRHSYRVARCFQGVSRHRQLLGCGVQRGDDLTRVTGEYRGCGPDPGSQQRRLRHRM